MWKKQVLVSPFPYETWTTEHKHPFFHHDGCMLDFYPCKNPFGVCGEISLSRETPQVLPVLGSHDSKDITHREAEKFLPSTPYFCWMYSVIDFMLWDLLMTRENPLRGKFVVQFLSCKMSSNKPHVHIARGWWKGWCFPHGKGGFVGCHVPLSQDSTSKLSAWLRKDFWKHSEHFALNAALQFL